MDERRLAENTIDYSLFPKIKSSQANAIERHLKYYGNEIYGKIGCYLTEYLWHNEPFNVKSVYSANDAPHLRGITTFGDNVEDEWFIVYLLWELTKSDPNLVVKVEDDDGDFLLIEAANYLPKWITPKKTKNRVYLYNGAVHVIPPNLKSGDNQGTSNTTSALRISDAVEVIRNESSVTRCDEAIQNCILQRISVFPNRIQEQKHKVKCFIPASIVALLRENPSFISYAVNAFYTRDPIDLKACKMMRYFPPENRLMAIVTMTRCQYAQLVSQKYKPDPKVGWNQPSENTQDFKAYDLGMKVACGFEILTASCKKHATTTEKPPLDSNAWNRFIASLESNGYFRGSLPQSKEYEKLLKQAESYFNNLSLNDAVYAGDVNSKSVIGHLILDKLRSVDLEKVEKDWLRSDEEEDSDDWMTMKPEELDQLLKESFQPDEASKLSELSSGLTEAINAFVNFEKSGLEGAEFPTKKERDPKEKVDFNPDAFEGALSSILSLNVPHSDSDASSSSGMSDYDGAEGLDSDDDELDEKRLRKSESEMDVAADTGVSSLAEEMKIYMEAMDRELAKTKVGLSFERGKGPPLAAPEDSESDDEYQPVNVDLNALKNLLESYKSQAGMPGPAGNILSSMGVAVPPDEDE